jgi:hypothetical protein
MRCIQNFLPMRWALNRIATVATLLLLCPPNGAAGQVSETLASSAHPDATAATTYIYWTNDKNGSVGRAETGALTTNLYPR